MTPAPQLPRMDAAGIRHAVLEQHQQIRAELVNARSVADAALDGAAPAPDAVASTIGQLCSTQDAHLAFEQETLVPFLRDDLPLGPERAKRLLDDHKRQQQTLAALHAEAKAHPELPTLAVKLASLAFWLLDDMAEEERWLLTTEVLSGFIATSGPG